MMSFVSENSGPVVTRDFLIEANAFQIAIKVRPYKFRYVIEIKFFDVPHGAETLRFPPGHARAGKLMASRGFYHYDNKDNKSNNKLIVPTDGFYSIILMGVSFEDAVILNKKVKEYTNTIAGLKKLLNLLSAANANIEIRRNDEIFDKFEPFTGSEVPNLWKPKNYSDQSRMIIIEDPLRPIQVNYKYDSEDLLLMRSFTAELIRMNGAPVILFNDISIVGRYYSLLDGTSIPIETIPVFNPRTRDFLSGLRLKKPYVEPTV